nr:PREDICTED: protein takeout-like [Bemisia tabaci]
MSVRVEKVNLIMRAHLSLCVLGFALAVSNAAVIKGGVEIPTYSEPCIRNSPDFNACLKKTIQYLIPKFALSGVPELNMTGLDPLYVPEYIQDYEGGEIYGKGIVKNSYVRGLAGLKVLDVRSKVNDPERMVLEVDFLLPKLQFDGTYKMEGAIGDLVVQGRGVYGANMTDITGTWKLKGHRVTVDGEDYMKIHEFHVRPQIGDAKFHATNLVNGNQRLSQVALTFVNQFWRVLYEAMLPFAESGFDKVARPVLNQVFLTVPYDQLFPLAKN